MPGEKAKDFMGTLKKLLAYMKPFYGYFVIIAMITITSTMFNIIGPKILGKATTLIYAGLVDKVAGGAGIDFSGLLKIILTLLSLYLLSGALGYVQQFIMAGVSNRVSFNLRQQFVDKIEKLPMKFFDTMTNGEVLSRITNDVDSISHSIGMVLNQVISSAITLVGVLYMMLSINWIMTITSLMILPLSTMVMKFVVSRSQKYFIRQSALRGEVNSLIEENYSGHLIVKAFNREEVIVKEFNDTADALFEAQWKGQFLSGMMHPIMGLIGNLNFVTQSILGAYFAIAGMIEVGDIQAFTQYVRNLNQPINQFSQIVNMLQSTIAAAERVFEIYEAEEEEPSNKVYSTDDIKGEVTFKNVKFGYTEDKIVIKDFNAEVKPGQMVALVGPTGAGKTTMVKLLMRFYNLNGGAIYVDGHDIKEYDRDELRRVFGMVLQDTWLFNGSIMENIRYGKMDATDEEVIQAAKTARVHHFVSTLPGGYNMELNEEASNVSAGQKQLLTIARAILADPKILILDEATSSVDTRTEILIQEAMDALMEGRTSFVIAHRLSTIKNADLILVINNGDIVEQGNHEELLAQNGFYAQLYNSQFEDVG
ncbi:MAG: ABC transporter ATP-binding protein [Eubacteriaceae bacterium]|nr:ABC transporter ATP-binding protein [Eubacteriaceae bacterium]